jgi:hypothetical protein
LSISTAKGITDNGPKPSTSLPTPPSTISELN